MTRPRDPYRRTKIVCTLGPASETLEQIRALFAAGMDVARLNFSHQTIDWHRERVAMIRDVSAEAGR
ncbi:MAG: pyruvate kinase, partial [Acidobacteriota bacterium]|nr:pyruvate kinase [Acidobacteriota bacterium]